MPEGSAAPVAIRDVENVWIPLRDGTRLAARIWLPQDAETHPVPAILEYIPYRKRDFMRLRDESIHPWFAARGYASIRVDLRGSGESGGIMHDEYLKQEQDDALEVIAWLADQPWCTGSVGMMGKSWGAFNALQVAARRPPALKAIIPVMGTDDRYDEDIHFAGGCLLNDNFWWGTIMQIFNARPPDPEIVGDQWRDMWLDRLQQETFWPETWLHHQTRDDFWKHGSVATNYSDIRCPVWIWGGWADLYRATPFRLAANLQAPCRVTMGPWAHLYPHEGSPGPAVGFLQEALRWWDHWLKAVDNGVMSEQPLQFYMQDSVPPRPIHTFRPGRWIAEAGWPSANVEPADWVLNKDRLGGHPEPSEHLTLSSPQTTGLAAADWCSFAVPGDVPGDQGNDLAGCLAFDTAPLEDRLEILGLGEVTLDVSSDRPSALLAIRLCDLRPDGTCPVIARGVLNLTHRNGHEAIEPLEPGTFYRVTVTLHPTAYAVPAGHRLRLVISNAYWPIVWPSPEATTLTLTSGTSKLSLPLRRSTDTLDEVKLPEPIAPPPASTTTLRPGSLERQVTIDQVTGAVSHRVSIDGGVFGARGKFVIDSIGMELGHRYERIYTIAPGDPNSARAEMTQTYEMGRGAWQVRIEAGAVMTSTPGAFELDAWVEAFEGDVLICRRDWTSSLPRNGI
ncbi:hypothetical protein FHS85_004729 [Rhodoligotrophos appendicifer]|uniref:CocE/NonD family hydrolase n=1 Tax=Rhodoligotrophos appendicifer TaxID=987056 RepID=UPI001185C4C0|nr:CocE/NonD family hydrolase [Rhodoligotrophos appendicifer]